MSEPKAPEIDDDGPQPGNTLMPGQQPRRPAGVGADEEEDGPQPGNEKFPPARPAAATPVEKPLERMEDLLAEDQAQATPRSKEPKVGQVVKGTVVKLGSDAAFVDIGAKSEAVLDLGPLRDEEGKPTVHEGDEIEAHVVSVGGKGGAIVLSKALTSGSDLRGLLGQAMETGLPVEGLVTAVNKGGLEVSVGGMRAFCPSSQVDLRFVEQPGTFIGKKLRFKVTKIDDGGRNVVLSRRALLEEENAGVAAKVREKLVVGAVLRGTVTSLRDYGAFIDLGAGIEGLLHVSEMSFGHVGHPSQVLTSGQEVEVQVLKIEAAAAASAGDAGEAKSEGSGSGSSKDKKKRPPKEQKISLSLKSLVEDPWAKVAEKFTIGSKVKGKVVRLQPFGAFVELAPGLDGLIHVSQLAEKRIMHPKDVVKPGQEVEVTVVAIEPDKKRIGLSMLDGAAREAALARESAGGGGGEQRGERPAGAGGERRGGGGGDRPAREDASARFKPGDVVIGKVDKIEAFGVFIKLEGGARALIPNVEMGTPRGADHKKLFPEGTEIRGVILPGEKGKLRMSKKGAEEADERRDAQEWNASQNKSASGSSGGSSSGPGFGTFGDLLKKLKK